MGLEKNISFEDVLSTKYPVTLFDGVTKPNGMSAAPSYRKFIENLSKLIISERKDTIALAPCRFKNNYRNDDNVQEINQLVFESDDTQGLSFEDIVDLVSPFAGVVHTTHGNKESNLRVRIALPISRPVSVKEWQEIRENFLFFNPEIARIIDPACSEPSRVYYAYSAPADRADQAKFYVSMGQPIRPEHFSTNRLPHLESSFPFHQNNHETLAQGGVKQGSRNRALASYLGGLINRGLSEQETLAECERWNETLDPPLDEDELNKTHASIWKRHRRNAGSVGQSQPIQGVNRAPKEGYNLIPASDFLCLKPKPREFVIDGFLPAEIVAGLFAPGGSGKSMLTLTTAISVASGTPLFGMFGVAKPGRVVLVSGEDDVAEIHRRLYRMTENLSESKKMLVGQNLQVLDLADRFELFTVKPSYGESEMTDVPQAIARVIEEKIGDACLIIVDPASRFRGGEENLAADTTRFVQALQYLRDRLQATIWLVHHVNKGARFNGASQNNARGSSALIDGLRLGYELNVIEASEVRKLYGDSVTGIELLSLRSIKSNYGRPAEPLTLQRNQDGTLSLFTQNPEDTRKKSLLRAIQAAGLTKTQFRDRHAGIKSTLGLSEKALVASIRDLVAEGLLKAPERGVMTLTQEGLNRIGQESSTGDERATK